MFVKMIISVIIPIYKTEKYLRQCIDSVLKQTHKKIEVILVDDGSPDECPLICDEYGQKDARIKIIHKLNGGLASARNCGLQIATGDYITFVDSDDYIKPDMLEKMITLAKNSNADVVQIAFEREGFKINKNQILDSHTETITGNDNIRLYALDHILRPEACGKLYRSELLRNTKFDCNIEYAEDVEFGLRFFKNVKCSVVSDEKMYCYRVNPNSLTSSSLSRGRLNEPTMLLNAALSHRNCAWLYKCILFRYVRCAFAVLNRMVSENKDDTYDFLRKNLMSLTFDILTNKHLTGKYKIGMFVLMICKTFKWYRRLILLIKR